MTNKPPIPTRLRELAGDAIVDEDDDHVGVTVKLRCPRCGGTKFILHLRYEQVHVGADAGKTLPFDPAWVACANCRYYALLFDDGCDGVNGLADDGPVQIPHSKVHPYHDATLPAYQVEVYAQFDKDGRTHFGPTGQPNPDAFDWLTILIEQPDGSMAAAIDFETA
jgi:hypothetical protein